MDFKFLQLRRYFSDTVTISELYRERMSPDAFQCFILEDKDRGLQGVMTEQALLAQKVAKETAIPYDIYEIIVNRSERFSKKASEKAGKPVDVLMPLLLNTKAFRGVRIHPGIKAEHTEGCLLTGNKFVDSDPRLPGFEQLADSTNAYNEVVAVILEKLKAGKVFIDIQKHPMAETFTLKSSTL